MEIPSTGQEKISQESKGFFFLPSESQKFEETPLFWRNCLGHLGDGARACRDWGKAFYKTSGAEKYEPEIVGGALLGAGALIFALSGGFVLPAAAVIMAVSGFIMILVGCYKRGNDAIQYNESMWGAVGRSTTVALGGVILGSATIAGFTVLCGIASAVVLTTALTSTSFGLIAGGGLIGGAALGILNGLSKEDYELFVQKKNAVDPWQLGEALVEVKRELQKTSRSIALEEIVDFTHYRHGITFEMSDKLVNYIFNTGTNELQGVRLIAQQIDRNIVAVQKQLRELEEMEDKEATIKNVKGLVNANVGRLLRTANPIFQSFNINQYQSIEKELDLP